MPVTPKRFHLLEGTITSVGFASGDRVVIGDWTSGPLGPMLDLMWADPTGQRTLIAVDREVAQFVSAIYRFETVEVDESLRTIAGEDHLTLSSERFDLLLTFGHSIPIPFRRLRNPHVTRYIEHPIARRLMRVHTFGVTAEGMYEWYQADRIRRVVHANGMLDGSPLGVMTAVSPPLKVGFSEPPRRPSSVTIRPRLYDPSGKLDALVDEFRRRRAD